MEAYLPRWACKGYFYDLSSAAVSAQAKCKAPQTTQHAKRKLKGSSSAHSGTLPRMLSSQPGVGSHSRHRADTHNPTGNSSAQKLDLASTRSLSWASLSCAGSAEDAHSVEPISATLRSSCALCTCLATAPADGGLQGATALLPASALICATVCLPPVPAGSECDLLADLGLSVESRHTMVRLRPVSSIAVTS